MQLPPKQTLAAAPLYICTDFPVMLRTVGPTEVTSISSIEALPISLTNGAPRASSDIKQSLGELYVCLQLIL